MVDTYTDYPSREEMAKQLTEINLGYDPEKNKPYDWYKLSRRKSSDINKYWLANKLTHNLGDINKIEFLMPLSWHPIPANNVFIVSLTLSMYISF